MTASRSPQAVKASQLWFTGPRTLEIREALLQPPAAGELLVRSLCSAVSAGTELLVYRGQLPQDMSLDANLRSLQDESGYPLQYGYACVGQVEQTGAETDASWLGRLVFSFQPHATHFVTKPDALIALPEGIAPEAGVFLANMETAVNLVQDGSPGIGEQVIVLGQGIVGLLLSGLLSQFPLSGLRAVDDIAARRVRAREFGVRETCDPSHATKMELPGTGADLVYEVSGAPEALNLALELSGFASRIVIGSWYGTKSTAIALGGKAHRDRIRITTSQVSTIAPELCGRWNKSRRFDLAWEQIRRLQPERLITHRVPLSEADALYRLLHESPAEVMQAVFIYD